MWLCTSQVCQDNIPHGNVSSQIIALLTAVYVHYLLTRKCIPSQLRLMPSQKDGPSVILVCRLVLFSLLYCAGSEL